MQTFNHLNLYNYVTWKELDLPIIEGVSFISGANYSGKSTIFNSLLPLLYDEGDTPVGATVSLSISNKNNYKFSLNKTASKSQFDIVENGVDLAIHKITTARNFIKKNFCLSSDLFNTTILLNGRKEHPLASGKPANRLEFLLNTLTSSLHYEQYQTVIDSTLSNLNKKSIELKTLKNTLKMMEVVEKPSLNEEETEKEIFKIKEEINKLSEEMLLINRALSIKAPKFEGSFISIEKALNIKNKLQKSSSTYISPEKKEKLKKAVSHLNKLKEILNIPEHLSVEDIKDRLPKKIDKLKNLIDEYENFNKQRERYSHLLDFINTKKPKESKQELKSILESLEIENSFAKRLLEQDLTDSKCPLCHSEHDISSLIEKAKITVASYKKSKNKYENYLKIIEAHSITWLSKPSESLSKLNEDLDNLNNLSKLCSILEGEDLSSINNNNISDPIKLEAVENYIYAYKKYDEEREIEKNNKFLDKENLEAISKVKRKKLEELNDKINSLNISKLKFDMKMQEYQRWKSNYTSLSNQIKDYSNIEEDLVILKGLKQAFSRDGFRLFRLQQLTEMFVANLNHLIPIIVQEPMKFEVLLDKRKCDILATRNGKKSSIFSLSGAESQIFKIISALALIRCLPSSSRADTIILDEIEANGDERFVTAYARDFITELRKSVNKIIVISPKTLKNLPLKPDYSFVVEKTNGRSKLLTY